MMQDQSAALAKEPQATTLTVRLAERSYDIVIAERLLDAAGQRIAVALPGARCAVVSDTTVAALYLPRLKASLEQHGPYLGEAVVAPGEASKSFPVLAKVCDRLLDLGVERGDAVVALGGGVVGDLAGFAASILRRGVRFVQIPTTLLAQVDSSVGGKTGIDTSHGKNLIGTFHQPSLVLADISVLTTLTSREFRSGYAEVLKYGLLGNASFFAWLEASWPRIFSSEGPDRASAIATSCRAKVAIVEADEREETGTRALLNLGHTFGHALEAYACYSDRLLHGEAIAIGMRLAFSFSAELGLCPASDVTQVERHLEAVGLPCRIAEVPGETPGPERLLQLMAQDKKVKGGKLALVLVRGVGEAFVERDIAMDRLSAFLARECGGR
jgi:3-dehydroquinate synthase